MGKSNVLMLWKRIEGYKQIVEFFVFASQSVRSRNSKILKGQIEIVKSENRHDHGQQNEAKDKLRTHNTTLKTKAGATWTGNRYLKE